MLSCGANHIGTAATITPVLDCIACWACLDGKWNGWQQPSCNRQSRQRQAQVVSVSGRLTTKKGTLEASGGGCKACIVCALMVPVLSPGYASRLTPGPPSFTFSRGGMLKEVRLHQSSQLPARGCSQQTHAEQ